MNFLHLLNSILMGVVIVGALPQQPSPAISIHTYDGETTGDYIVKFKDNLPTSSKGFLAANKLKGSVAKSFNGFVGALSTADLEALRHSDDVEFIEEDGIMHAFATVTQKNAPWGLGRISQDAKLSSQASSALNFTYTYDSSAGAGVDIYVVDTGVYTAHADFGGRAIWGATLGGYADVDGSGHGTHCAGIAAGTQYGVAKAATIIAVKVLSDSGSGATSSIVAGLNWVLTRAQTSGRPSVAVLALGGSASVALDNVVTSLTTAGVHVVVAAGNSNTDASSSSPARVPSAITVGSSTIGDARHSASNYGSVVDIFAPGINVISTWIGSLTATNTLSGTSMAACHMAGLIAVLISQEGNFTPLAISNKVKAIAVKNALTGVPSGTVNYLANNA